MASAKVCRAQGARQRSLFDAPVRIPLTGKHGRGKVALVSPADADLAAVPWWGTPYGYAHGGAGPLHLVVLERVAGPRPSDKHEADHANRDRLDNRRGNLRWATKRQNNLNRDFHGRKTAGGMRGVGELAYTDGTPFYQPRLYVNGKTVALGSYPDAETAGRVYDAYASLYYGAFAVLNFPGDEPWSLDECENARVSAAKQRTWAKPPWERLNALTGKSYLP